MKKYYYLLASLILIGTIITGCGNKNEKIESEDTVVTQEIEPVKTTEPEVVVEEPEEVVEEPSPEEIALNLRNARLENARIKVDIVIDTYKDIANNGHFPDIFNVHSIERQIFDTYKDSRNYFKDGSSPVYDWPSSTSVIQQFIRRVNLGEAENFDTVEWFLQFEDEADFEASQDRWDVFPFTDEEQATIDWDTIELWEYYMYTTTQFAATMAQHEGLIEFGEPFETDEYVIRNDKQSKYAVPIILNGVDYGIIAVFDENDLMLNIVSTDDSQKEEWFFYSL